MAKVQQDRIQLVVEVNGKQVNNTIKDLRKEYSSLIKLRNSATIGSDEQKKLAQEAARVKRLINEQVDAQKDLERGIKAGTRATTLFGRSAQAIGGILKTAFAPLLALSAFQGLFNLGRELLQAGTELEAFEIKSETVFASALDDVERFAAANALNLGLTRREYINQATAIGDLLIPMKFQREEAANISAEVVNLSGAMAEWSGGQKTAEEASTTLAKAILGEREELKQYGISLNEADIKTRLALKGQKDLTSEALKQAKALATLELIQEKSADAQAKFANNTGSLARQSARFSARISEIVERFKIGFIPVLGSTLSFLNRLIGNTSQYSEELAREQIELNKLVIRITATNQGEEERGKLLNELQKTYPGFLGNLSKEAVTNEQLAGRLKDVNKELVNKIILQRQEEKLSEQREEIANRLERQIKAEVQISEALVTAQQKFNIEIEAGGSLSEKAGKAIEDLTEFTSKWGQALDPAERAQRKLFNAVKEYEAATANLNEGQEVSISLLKEQTALRERLGITLDDQTGGEAAAPVADIPSAPTIESGPDPGLAEKEAERREKEREDLENEIRAAGEKIEDLRVSLIKEGTERRIEEIKLSTEREIAALQGTEEQIKTATVLINQRAENEISIIKTEAARTQREEASKEFSKELESLEAFYTQRNQIVTENIISEARGGQISELEAEKELRKRLLDELIKYLEAKKKAIEAARDQERISTEEAAGLLLELEGQLSDERLAAFEREIEARQQKAEKEVEIEKNKGEQIQKIADAATQVSGEVFKLVTTIQETEAKKQLKNLEAQKKKELAKAGEDEAKKAEIEKKFRIEKSRLEAQAAAKKKDRAIKETLINTAVSIVKTGAELGYPAAIPLQVLAGVIGGIQLANISAQELREGGFSDRAKVKNIGFKGGKNSYTLERVEDRLPERGSGYIDGPTLYRENKIIAGEAGREWFAPNWMLKDPKSAAVISELEGMRVRGFEGGGFSGGEVLSDPIPAPSDEAIEAAEITSQDMLLERLDILIDVSARTKVAALFSENNALDMKEMLDEIEGRRAETGL